MMTATAVPIQECNATSRLTVTSPYRSRRTRSLKECGVSAGLRSSTAWTVDAARAWWERHPPLSRFRAAGVAVKEDARSPCRPPTPPASLKDAALTSARPVPHVGRRTANPKELATSWRYRIASNICDLAPQAGLVPSAMSEANCTTPEDAWEPRPTKEGVARRTGRFPQLVDPRSSINGLLLTGSPRFREV